MTTFEALVTEAGQLLAEGMTPVDVVTQLVEVHDPDVLDEVAAAVAVAVGVPRAEAEERLAGTWPLDEEGYSRAELARLYAEALEDWGELFDIRAECRDEDRRVVDLFAEALREVAPWIPVFLQRYRLGVRTGRLRDVLVHLSHPERSWQQADSPAYWQRLVDAAELLGPDGDDEYVAAVRRCRERASVTRHG